MAERHLTQPKRRPPQWLLAVRLLMLVSVAVLLLGLVIEGPIGGVLAILSGVGVLCVSMAILLDLGGLAETLGALFQEGVQRRMPWSAPPRASQRRLVSKVMGATAAMVGTAYCAAGIAMFAGWLRG